MVSQDTNWISQETNGTGIYIDPCEFGRGIFAKRHFRPGEFIFSFSGPIICFKDTLTKGETEANPLQIGPDKYFDLEPPGVFANHSCEPNTGISGGVNLIAIQDIQPGEEIRWDYSTSMSERSWTMTCKCGAPACRGRITDFHDLPQAKKIFYIGLGIVMPYIIEEIESFSKETKTSQGHR